MAVRQGRAPPPQEPPAEPPDPPDDNLNAPGPSTRYDPWDPEPGPSFRQQPRRHNEAGPSSRLLPRHSNEPGPSSRQHGGTLPPIYGPGAPRQHVPIMELINFGSEPTSGTDSLSTLTVETISNSLNQVSDCEDLCAVFQDCEIAISRFFNNDLEGAWSVIQPGIGSSIYHTLGAAIFDFIPSMLSFDNTQMAKAHRTIKTCLALCQRQRRSFSLTQSLGNMIRPNYASYTDHEAHAELVHSEVLLLQACLIVMEGEDLTGVLRSALKVKACYNGYKICAKILEVKRWQSPESEDQFRSGTCLGLAVFNILLSLLPPRIISLLEFAGFGGDKNAGLAELLKGSRAPGMHSSICSLGLLGYNLVVAHFIGAKINIEVCEEILHRELLAYPNGVWFLLFKGRLQLFKKEYNRAKENYYRSLGIEHSYPQASHLCYWELMWLHAVVFDWQQAAEFASKLSAENSWSKTTYYYAKACWLLMIDNPSEEIKMEIDECFDNAILHKQRIAGKSLPIEKFMVRRARRYKAQGNLLVPGYELLCLWNMFNCMTKDLGKIVIKNLENLQQDMGNDKEDLAWTKEYEGDNLALLRYLTGSMYVAMGLPQMSVEALHSIGMLRHRIREDHFLLPYAACELGYSHHLMGHLDQGYHIYNEIRKKYSNYALESRLQLKLQARIATLNAVMQAEELGPGAAAVQGFRPR